jgi:hypothetical protein
MQLNRFVVEVRGGVVLFFNRTTELDDGWWWGFNARPLQHGPFASSDEAVADASREMGRFKLVRWDDATIWRKNHEELRPTGHIVVIDTNGALFVKTGERPACEATKPTSNNSWRHGRVERQRQARERQEMMAGMSRKSIMATRRELVKRGVVVDSGQRHIQECGVLWVLNEELSEEQRQALAFGPGIVATPDIVTAPRVSLDAAAKTPSEAQSVVASRLFGADRWLAYEDEVPRLFKWVLKTGLAELVPGKPDSWRATALGKEMDVDLLVVFLGIFDELDVVEILADRGFIDSRELDRLWNLLDAGYDPEVVLKPIVRAAYRRYFERTLPQIAR